MGEGDRGVEVKHVGEVLEELGDRKSTFVTATEACGVADCSTSSAEIEGASSLSNRSPVSCSPRVQQRLSGNSYPRARRLTMSLAIAA